MSKHLSDYEIFFRNGSSFIITEVRSLEVETNDDRTINKLNIQGSQITDKLIYIDIKTISCIVKRKEYEKPKKRWWRK